MDDVLFYCSAFLSGIMVCSLFFIKKIKSIRSECDIWAMQAGKYRKAAFEAIDKLEKMEEMRDDIYSSVEINNGEF